MLFFKQLEKLLITETNFLINYKMNTMWRRRALESKKKEK
jgi:hypothetical protein